jgi:hypothetical protein
MALLDAKEYDPRPAKRRNRLIILAIVVVAAALAIWWMFRYWPQERVVNKFFEALERKDFDAAYGIYNADPDWKQHSEKYNQYPLPQFMLDWGPSGDYGVITSHKIDCAKEPPNASGVIVMVIVNGRAQETSMWVEKKAKTLTSPAPRELQCHPGG